MVHIGISCSEEFACPRQMFFFQIMNLFEFAVARSNSPHTLYTYFFSTHALEIHTPVCIHMYICMPYSRLLR